MHRRWRARGATSTSSRWGCSWWSASPRCCCSSTTASSTPAPRRRALATQQDSTSWQRTRRAGLRSRPSRPSARSSNRAPPPPTPWTRRGSPSCRRRSRRRARQAKGSQDELTKLRNSQKQTDSDRSGLLSRIDSLQKERDQLRQQLNAYNVQQTPQQKQLDDERKASASQAEELTRLRNENATLRSPKATVRNSPSLQEVTQSLRRWRSPVRAQELQVCRAIDAGVDRNGAGDSGPARTGVDWLAPDSCRTHRARTSPLRCTTRRSPAALSYRC